MNVRIIKELRALLPALGIALVLVCLMPFRVTLLFGKLNESPSGDSTLLESLALSPVGPLLVIAAFCAVASAAFANEFQWRTLPLLLAQPLTRARVWAEKHAVMLCTLTGAMLLYFALLLVEEIQFSAAAPLFGLNSQEEQGGVFLREALFWFLLMVPVICSAGFWSILTRSLIGAVVLNLGAQTLFVLLLDQVVSISRRGVSLFKSANLAQLDGALMMQAIAVAVYSAAMLWLGWKKFNCLQMAEAASGESRSERGDTEVERGTVAMDHPATQQAPAGPSLWCFARKELRLQKPALLLAIIYTALWLLILLLATVTHRGDDLDGYLGVLAAFYIPLSIILAGCIPMSEEGRMGLIEWHLTLPIARHRISLLKMVVGGFVAALTGIVLPTMLALATYGPFRESFIEGWEVILFLIFLATVFMVSFWAACLLRDVIRAALAAVCVCVIGVLLCYGSVHILADSMLQVDLVSRLAAELQWPSHQFLDQAPIFVVLAWTLTLLALLAGQSFAALKWNLCGQRRVVRNLVVLLPTMAVLTFWAADFLRSSRSWPQRVGEEVYSAAQFYLEQHPSALQEGKVMPKDLEAAAPLSLTTRRFLRNAQLEFIDQKFNVVLKADLPHGGTEWFWVTPPWFKAAEPQEHRKSEAQQ